jgi:hypothetical protein
MALLLLMLLGYQSKQKLIFTMSLTSIADLSDAQKEELVASLSCLVIGSGEVSAEKISAVATASGNSVSDALATLFSGVVTGAPKGVESFTPPPGGGGGGGGG